MAATTTPSMNSLLLSLRRDYPTLVFQPSSSSRWDYETSTVYYFASDASAQLLHEVGHASLGHRNYTRDITLLEMERQAWDKANQLAKSYGVTLDTGVVEAHLDSYRDWLHRRSTCPTCESNGIQTADSMYRCPRCDTSWRVNQAKTCALRRYITKT